MSVLSTERVDYLQRTIIHSHLSTDAESIRSNPGLNKLTRIKGIGRLFKDPNVIGSNKDKRPPSEDILTGLYTYKIPMMFLVRGSASGIQIHFGISYQDPNQKTTKLENNLNTLTSLLNSLYPTIEYSSSGSLEELLAFPLSGIGMGIPTIKSPDPYDMALPIDRLIRAMRGNDWACLILAEPISETMVGKLRDSIINEMRFVQSAVVAGSPKPLGDYYMKLLESQLAILTSSQVLGCWRTGVYLLGNEESYYYLASVWRGLFSGNMSMPEPIYVVDCRQVAKRLAIEGSLPETPAEKGPGFFHHPFQFQTLLASNQLAAFVGLPNLETSGFSITTVPNFDSVSPIHMGNGKTVSIGHIIDGSISTSNNYTIDVESLKRHVFVAGVTGSGKTNTILSILKQLDLCDLPFTIIEPAKTEYRAMIKDSDLKHKIQIFTLGNENVSRFRLNPFEVPAGIPVGVHIDLLRSVFSVSFGMWTPLPQILEQCLHSIYLDHGWDVTRNINRRLSERSEMTEEAFPTLSELQCKVDEVINLLGYEQKVTGDMRAALHVRIDALRMGGKGRMLDIRHSIPTGSWLEQPTIFELENMGDDDDKSFMMALLLIRLAEHRRTMGQSQNIRHVLVIEEAHRLLSNVGQRYQEESNPRGKAVETFSSLLSEIRAYGQGVIIADQVPVRLAPEIIKNTTLKISHRIVAADDRAIMAGAMAMSEEQARALTTIRVGEAAIFSEGDDVPLLVKISQMKNTTGRIIVTDEEVSEYMKSMPINHDPKFFVSHVGCANSDSNNEIGCEIARSIVESHSFQRDFNRLILSMVEDDNSLPRLWPQIVEHINSKNFWRDKERTLRCLIARAAYWFANHRGSQGGWTYEATRVLAECIRMLLTTYQFGENWTKGIEAFRSIMYKLHNREVPPYHDCERICTQKIPLCLYRHAVQDLLYKPELAIQWDLAGKEGRMNETGISATWKHCLNAAQLVNEWHSSQVEALKRIGLCYAQLRISTNQNILPEVGAYIMDKLIHNVTLSKKEETNTD
jgi:hypothetical protein